jgi:hypothetical protein
MKIMDKTEFGSFYGMGFIGAAIYYLQHAVGFWMGVLGFLKAIFWPAALVYGLFSRWGL